MTSLTRKKSPTTIAANEVRRRRTKLLDIRDNVLIAGEDYGVFPGVSKPTLLKPGAERLCEIYGLKVESEVLSHLQNPERRFFSITVKVKLLDGEGVLTAEGLGSCNSRESWLRGQDPFLAENTVLKIAKKRALIDGVLSAVRGSFLFTQDVEHIGAAAERQGELEQLFSLVRELGISNNEAKELLYKRYQVKQSSELSEEQLQDLTYYLKGLQSAAVVG